MNTLPVAFDKHEHIIYNDIDHLYWGEYAYRVSIEVNARKIRDSNQMRRAMSSLMEEVKNDNDIVFRKKRSGYNFFFQSAKEAEVFIDDNSHLIDKVTRPRDEEEIETLKDAKIRLRSILWFNRFGFVITFAGDTWKERCQTIDDVDSYVTNEFFPDDDFSDGKPYHGTDRAYYRKARFGKRRLYLRDEADLILVKLALDNDQIEGIEVAKLRQ